MPLNEEQIFQKYFPAASVPYCMQLWERHKVQFRISPPRSSIYGNYRFRNGIHEISVNGNLNKEAFLVTYIHEMAHLMVRIGHGNRTLPHGPEWKFHFRELMEPVLNSAIFPEPALSALKEHLRNPSATSCADPTLHRLLGYENHTSGAETDTVEVSELGPNDAFIFRSQRYVWVRKSLKRIECQQIETNRMYRFRADVRVLPAGKHTFPKPAQSSPLLGQLAIGQTFELAGRKFRLMEMKRKNAVCRDLDNGRDYLISGMAPVENASLI
jgi:predicted SprT family Zn-dependent metalloprotease